MKTTFIYTLAACLCACSTGRPAAAQTPIVWTIAPLSGALRNGLVTNVRIDAKLQDGWHIYSVTQPAGGPIATRITVPPGQHFVLAGNPKSTTKPSTAFDDAFHMNVQLHEKAVSFDVPVRSSSATTGAGDLLRVNVRYQVCNASLCFPPQTAKLATPVSVAAR